MHPKHKPAGVFYDCILKAFLKKLYMFVECDMTFQYTNTMCSDDQIRLLVHPFTSNTYHFFMLYTLKNLSTSSFKIFTESLI